MQVLVFEGKIRSRRFSRRSNLKELAEQSEAFVDEFQITCIHHGHLQGPIEAIHFDESALSRAAPDFFGMLDSKIATSLVRSLQGKSHVPRQFSRTVSWSFQGFIA